MVPFASSRMVPNGSTSSWLSARSVTSRICSGDRNPSVIVCVIDLSLASACTADGRGKRGGGREQVALGEVGAARAEPRELGLGLHALGHAADAQPPGQRQQLLDYAPLVGVGVDAAHQRAV